MALETEQRLEAVREWARSVLDLKDDNSAKSWAEYLNAVARGELRPRPRPYIQGKWSPHLMWHRICNDAVSGYTLREDMADVIWGVLIETGKLEE